MLSFDSFSRTAETLGPVIQRVSDSPLLGPGDAPGYDAIFNAGLLHHGDKFQLFARGIRSGYTRNPGVGDRFLNYVSDVLLFTSVDGVNYEFERVLLRSDECGLHAIEDPRVQLVYSRGEPHLVMTYTKLHDPALGRPWQIGAHLILDSGNGLEVDHSSGVTLGPSERHDKDAILFNLADGRIVFMHRIHPDMQIAIFDDLEHLWHADDDSYWDDHLASLEEHTIVRPESGSLGVGAGAPTLRGDAGLWLFFHERRADGHYTLRVALIDDETGRVNAILPGAILEPELEWECVGDVDNVVFVQGVHRLDDDRIYLTYGAADRYVGAAIVDERALLELFALSNA